MTTEEFAGRFKQARRAAGLTQVQAAALLGITQSRIADYEAGSYMPGADRIVDMVTKLKLDPAIMFPEFRIPRGKKGKR